jgi:transposase
MLPKPKKRGCHLTDWGKIIEAIIYILKGGVQWRILPSDFPPWQTVYHLFRKWNKKEFMGCAQQSIACPCQRCPRQTIPPHRRDFGQPMREKRPARWQRRLRCLETYQGQKTTYINGYIGFTGRRAHHPREFPGSLWSQRVARWSPSNGLAGCTSSGWMVGIVGSRLLIG